VQALQERSRVASGLRKGWLVLGMGVALGGLLAWAWHDGGEQPLHEITEPALLPGNGR
jgi:hypothetical protein